MIFVTPAHPLNILDYSTSSIRMERQSQSIQVPESSRRECVHLISSIVAFLHPGSMGQCHNTLLESKVMPWTIAQNNDQQKQDYHTYDPLHRAVRYWIARALVDRFPRESCSAQGGGWPHTRPFVFHGNSSYFLLSMVGESGWAATDILRLLAWVPIVFFCIWLGSCAQLGPVAAHHLGGQAGQQCTALSPVQGAPNNFCQDGAPYR